MTGMGGDWLGSSPGVVASLLQQSSPSALDWLMVALRAITVLIAVWWAVRVVVEARRTAASKSWPSIEGMVVSSWVETRPWGGGHRFQPVLHAGVCRLRCIPPAGPSLPLLPCSDARQLGRAHEQLPVLILGK